MFVTDDVCPECRQKLRLTVGARHVRLVYADHHVRNAGYPSPVRTPRGEDIMAACGQLKSASERTPKHALDRAPAQ